MTRRRKKSRIARSLSKVAKEATGTVVSALGLVPGIGTALGIVDTSRKAVRTARATGQASRVLRSKMRRRRRPRRR